MKIQTEKIFSQVTITIETINELQAFIGGLKKIPEHGYPTALKIKNELQKISAEYRT